MAVGPQNTADGLTPPTGRQARTGESVVTQAHGKYYEASSRGVLFGACDQGAGIAVQTSITTTALLALFNPTLTKVRASIKKVSIGYFSGTMPAGTFYHGFLPPGSAAPSGGTQLTASFTDVGYAVTTTAICVCRANCTVATGTALYVFGSSFVELATTANGFQPFVEDVDGLICLEPGAQYQILGVFGAGGSSPKVSPSIIWEEVPYVQPNG